MLIHLSDNTLFHSNWKQMIKSIVYVYTINEKSQNETKETISFTTGSKRIKRLKINKRSTKFIV